jgi:hypothetical protein
MRTSLHEAALPFGVLNGGGSDRLPFDLLGVCKPIGWMSSMGSWVATTVVGVPDRHFNETGTIFIDYLRPGNESYFRGVAPVQRQRPLFSQL